MKYDLTQFEKLMLFLADRSYHVRNLIKEKRKDHIVICDRYFYSTWAYQSTVLNNYASETRSDLHYDSTDCVEPDICYYIEISIEEMLVRLKNRNNNNNKLDNMSKEYYQEVKDKFDQFKDRYKLIYGCKSITEISNDIYWNFRYKFINLERYRRS